MRAFFEPRFGVDLGGVRVHDDGRATKVARSIQAQAFTYGRDIVFDAGGFAPHSASGRRLLAHELTHVVQQGGGAAPSPAASLRVSQPDDPAEQEADRVSQTITQGDRPVPHRVSAHVAPSLMRAVRFGPDMIPPTITTLPYPPPTEDPRGVGILPTGHTFSWGGGVHVLGDAGDPCTDWEVGPMQTVKVSWANAYWDHTHWRWSMPTPIRDVMQGDPGPWTSVSQVRPCRSCGDFVNLVNPDRPALARPDGQPAGNTAPHHFIPWNDPRTGAANTLNSLNWGHNFVAFGVVHNRTTGEFRPLQHVYWSMQVSAIFDRTRPIGSRGRLHDNLIQHSNVQNGPASDTPFILTGPDAKDSWLVTESAV